MNKTRMTWGILCLVLAGVLAVLSFTLPPENLVFTVGDQNMPWIPAAVLGIIGIVLLATAGRGETEIQATEAEAPKPQAAPNPEKAALNKRMEGIAWGLFLIMLGGFMFIPETTIKKGVWSIGVGLIFLGLNAARYANQIKMSGFTTVLGILSVVAGVVQLFGVLKDAEGAILIIILGIYLIFKPQFDRRQMFGKAEES